MTELFPKEVAAEFVTALKGSIAYSHVIGGAPVVDGPAGGDGREVVPVHDWLELVAQVGRHSSYGAAVLLVETVIDAPYPYRGGYKHPDDPTKHASSVLTKAATPPFFCTSATACSERVVLPLDSGP